MYCFLRYEKYTVADVRYGVTSYLKLVIPTIALQVTAYSGKAKYRAIP